MAIHDIHSAVPAWLPVVDARLATIVADASPTLGAAARAVATAPGKRVRPLLLLLSCSCFGAVNERAYTYAALVELIHTASLVHDDVVDEADLRRGAPSARARWDNKFSILLGDYLIARVFQAAVEDGDIAAFGELANTAVAMVRGVTTELSDLDADADETTYWEMIRGKTAALFASSARIGALIGGADHATQMRLWRAGEAYGLAFQVADDLTDLLGSEDESGKSLGLDWRHRRATLPLLHALRHASDADARAMRALWGSDPLTDDDLRDLRALVATYGGFDYARGKVQEYVSAASALLPDAPGDAEAREAMARLIGAAAAAEAVG